MRVKIKTWERMLKEFPNTQLIFPTICPKGSTGCIFLPEMEKRMPPDRIIEISETANEYGEFIYNDDYLISLDMIECFIYDKYIKQKRIKQRNYKLTI